MSVRITPIASNAIELELRNGDRYQIQDSEDGKLTISTSLQEGKRPEFTMHPNIFETDETCGKTSYLTLQITKKVRL